MPESYLKEYIAQSVPNEEERQQRQTLPPKTRDPNPFTLRSFLHDNIAQSILSDEQAKVRDEAEATAIAAQRAGGPTDATVREGNPNELAINDKPNGSLDEKPKEKKTFGQRIKEAFGKGEKETGPKEEGIKNDGKVENKTESNVVNKEGGGTPAPNGVQEPVMVKEVN